MAEYRAEEILVIEPGSEFVTRYKPFKVKSKLCEALPGMLAGIRKIVIGKNIAVIGESAFAGCEELCEVEISDGVTEIGANATIPLVALLEKENPGLVKNSIDAFGHDALWYTLYQRDRFNRATEAARRAMDPLDRTLIEFGCDPDRANDLGLSYNDLTV